MTEPHTQVDPISEIISELSRHVANLKKENAELTRKYKCAWASSAAASINADSLKQFAYDARCNICSFAGQSEDDIVGTTGTKCKKCGELICLECNGYDRAMWCDMQHTCKTCKNAILCFCKDFCDVCNGSTSNAFDEKRLKRSAAETEDYTVISATTTVTEVEKSEPDAKKRALGGDDDDNDKDE